MPPVPQNRGFVVRKCSNRMEELGDNEKTIQAISGRRHPQKKTTGSPMTAEVIFPDRTLRICFRVWSDWQQSRQVSKALICDLKAAPP